MQLIPLNFSSMLTFAPALSSTKPARPTNPDTVLLPMSEAAIDSVLVRRFVAGDEAAFVEIMERYRGKIFTVVLGLLRNHADTEEITQDTFIRAHRGLARFRGDSSLSTWLYRIAVNLSRNHYWFFFRRQRQNSLSLDCALSEDNAGTLADLVADVVHDPAQETVTSEFSTLVDGCVEQLDARHREILNLHTVLNYSYRQIATTLGINVGTVKSRLARARGNLRRLLAEACPEFAPGAELSEWFLHSRSINGRHSIACA